MKLLMPSEVSKRLGVSPKTLNNWADRGELACIKTLGGHRRFHEADVEEFARRMGLRKEVAP
jgi:excisionase family DNA binding protein